MKKTIHRLYTDGGSRGNPGQAAWGFILCDNGRISEEHAGYMNDHSTNNEAEYMALIMGLDYISKHRSGVKALKCYSDSRLIVNQLNGKWRIKEPRLRAYHDKIVVLMQQFSKVTFKWIPRNHKRIKYADMLVNQILDEKLMLDMNVG